MRRVLSTERGSELYKQRAQLIEPIFGNTKHNRGFIRFARRGRSAARTEWRLIATTQPAQASPALHRRTHMIAARPPIQAPGNADRRNRPELARQPHAIGRRPGKFSFAAVGRRAHAYAGFETGATMSRFCVSSRAGVGGLD
jgi:hypothetical protein